MNYEPEKRYSDSVGINDELDEDDRNFMQYTGLKDKNGKGIYEGDIFKMDDVVGVIFWNEFSASFCTSYNGITDTMLNNMEIIGNIYKNNNLLTKNK